MQCTWFLSSMTSGKLHFCLLLLFYHSYAIAMWLHIVKQLSLLFMDFNRLYHEVVESFGSPFYTS